jgi:hypothetical protein
MSTTNATRANCANSALAKVQITNAAIFTPISPESKEFSEVANKFASCGHDLSRIDDETQRYYVSRHGRALLVHSWMAVKTLLVHIGRSA